MAGRLDRLLDWLFPRRCAFCGHPVETGQTACSRCREELPRIAGPVCPLCGREKGSCRCGQRRRAYRRCVSPFYYEGPAKRGILRLKLYGKVYAAEGFAQAMAETVRREYEGIAFDALVPVPISDSTRRERGYNQSERLASALGKGLAVPVAEGLVKVANGRFPPPSAAEMCWGCLTVHLALCPKDRCFCWWMMFPLPGLLWTNAPKC